MSDMTISQTIYNQLGGNKFTVMTGATNFVSNGHDLSFKFSHNASRSNYLRITLDASTDTYTLQFTHIRKHDLILDKRFDLVHYDQLRSIFEEYTGLYIRL